MKATVLLIAALLSLSFTAVAQNPVSSQKAAAVQTSSQNQSKVLFNVYPNPFDSELTVKFDGETDGETRVTIEIYNPLNGQKVLEESLSNESNALVVKTAIWPKVMFIVCLKISKDGELQRIGRHKVFHQ